MSRAILGGVAEKSSKNPDVEAAAVRQSQAMIGQIDHVILNIALTTLFMVMAT